MAVAALLLPLVAAIVAACGVVAAHRSAVPRRAARVSALLVALLAMAWVPTLLLVVLAFLAHLPVVGTGAQWCAQVVGIHAAVPAWVGLPALTVAVFGGVRVWRVLRARHRLCRSGHGHPQVVPHPQPFAVTLPGRGGAVVLSSGLMALLDEREQQVVVAHESSHSRHRHDRYLLVAELGAAVLPALRWMADRVRLAVERWADEDAAAIMGDRALVAATLGKVALHRSAPPLALAFGGHAVVTRVAALLAPPPPRQRGITRLLAWGSIAMVAFLAAVQLHHLEQLAAALCPH